MYSIKKKARIAGAVVYSKYFWIRQQSKCLLYVQLIFVDIKISAKNCWCFW